jgi:5S rRNA maturation endonuclease (ribonuclease M5)
VGWLRGKIKIANVVIAEGLTSTLAVSMAMKKLGRINFGVFGYTSGSQSCIKDMPWDGQTVYVMTDNDKAGNTYAEKIEACLPPSVHVRRGTL